MLEDVPLDRELGCDFLRSDFAFVSRKRWKIFNRGLHTCLFLIFLCPTQKERGRIQKEKLKEMENVTNFYCLFLIWAGIQNVVPWPLCIMDSQVSSRVVLINICVFLNK